LNTTPTSVTTHFKKLTAVNNVFVVKLSHPAVFNQMFSVSAFLLDDAPKPATTLTNGTINEMLQQFAPFSDDTLETLWDL